MSEEIRVGVGITKNLGDFNSLRLDVGRTTEIRDNETPEEAYERAWGEVETQIETKVSEAEIS